MHKQEMKGRQGDDYYYFDGLNYYSLLLESVGESFWPMS